jgi:hypothetical protein
MSEIVRKMATKVWLRSRIAKLQALAYAEAASRRQAKPQTISKFEFRMSQTDLLRNLAIW